MASDITTIIARNGMLQSTARCWLLAPKAKGSASGVAAFAAAAACLLLPQLLLPSLKLSSSFRHQLRSESEI